jgi:hypothetical protein
VELNSGCKSHFRIFQSAENIHARPASVKNSMPIRCPTTLDTIGTYNADSEVSKPLAHL